MESPLYQLLHKCVVQIEQIDAGSRTIGTGFFVARGVILTVAHNIEKFAAQRADIRVYWQGHTLTANLIVKSSIHYPDLAFLRAGIDINPCVYLHEALNPKDDIYTYGFSRQTKNGRRAEPVLLTAEGVTERPEAMIKLKMGEINPGLSGAPLLNCTTGCVCGIVKSTRQESSYKGGFGIPTSVVFSTMKTLAQEQINYHLQNPEWLDCLEPDQLDALGIIPIGALSPFNNTIQELIVAMNWSSVRNLSTSQQIVSASAILKPSQVERIIFLIRRAVNPIEQLLGEISKDSTEMAKDNIRRELLIDVSSFLSQARQLVSQLQKLRFATPLKINSDAQTIIPQLISDLIRKTREIAKKTTLLIVQ
ncbi:S1 family peptidase [Candidatus Chloroploca asiatica]|uniref:S1 family peptidase n=1 Tax=Candidatus Chloroploca asiatica TaxID=1506545 RepID=UPI000BE83DE6|nr:serine protease [Candidatus Chloroploca asiatica]